MTMTISDILKYLIGICVGIVVGVACALWFQAMKKETKKAKEEVVVSVKWRQTHFILNEENLYSELVAQGVDFPEIVQAQAILETGHFKSHACLQQNNLFGLRNGNGTYMSFDHWTNAVAAYKKFIQKYDTLPNNYYKYLRDLGYAEDPDYIIKLKQIVNRK